MPSAYEIALDVLRSFGPNVVARKPPLTYGEYAKRIGKKPNEYAQAVGHAMHAIGAVCVIREIPVAPLFWVKRADGLERRVFESDSLEKRHVLDSGDFDVMYVVAREYQYSLEEFAAIEKALAESLHTGRLTEWSPHQLWHLSFTVTEPSTDMTHYRAAMARYRLLFEQIKRERSASK